MRLNKLAPSTKKKGRWLCHLEDDTILRVGEGEVVAFGLYTGMELDETQMEALVAAAGRSGVREQALGLIAVRPLSRKELLRKLAQREIDPAMAEEAADWLEGLGYLNESDYARAVAEHYVAKGYGERKIRDELYRRGVDREHWQVAVEGTAAPDCGIDAFLQSKLKGLDPDQKTLKRVTDGLARRGYRWDDIKAGLRRYGAAIEED